jgi:hypothetical protein
MSHNIKTLQKFPTSRLKKLYTKYSNMKTKEATKEASVIKKILSKKMNEDIMTTKEHYKLYLHEVTSNRYTFDDNFIN